MLCILVPDPIPPKYGPFHPSFTQFFFKVSNFFVSCLFRVCVCTCPPLQVPVQAIRGSGPGVSYKLPVTGARGQKLNPLQEQ